MCWPTRTTSRNVGKRLPAPSMIGPEPTTAGWGWADGAGGAGKLHSAVNGCCIPSSAVTS